MRQLLSLLQCLKILKLIFSRANPSRFSLVGLLFLMISGATTIIRPAISHADDGLPPPSKFIGFIQSKDVYLVFHANYKDIFGNDPVPRGYQIKVTLLNGNTEEGSCSTTPYGASQPLPRDVKDQNGNPQNVWPSWALKYDDDQVPWGMCLIKWPNSKWASYAYYGDNGGYGTLQGILKNGQLIPQLEKRKILYSGIYPNEPNKTALWMSCTVTLIVRIGGYALGVPPDYKGCKQGSVPAGNGYTSLNKSLAVSNEFTTKPFPTWSWTGGFFGGYFSVEPTTVYDYSKSSVYLHYRFIMDPTPALEKLYPGAISPTQLEAKIRDVLKANKTIKDDEKAKVIAFLATNGLGFFNDHPVFAKGYLKTADPSVRATFWDIPYVKTKFPTSSRFLKAWESNGNPWVVSPVKATNEKQKEFWRNYAQTIGDSNFRDPGIPVINNFLNGMYNFPDRAVTYLKDTQQNAPNSPFAFLGGYGELLGTGGTIAWNGWRLAAKDFVPGPGAPLYARVMQCSERFCGKVGNAVAGLSKRIPLPILKASDELVFEDGLKLTPKEFARLLYLSKMTSKQATKELFEIRRADEQVTQLVRQLNQQYGLGLTSDDFLKLIRNFKVSITDWTEEVESGILDHPFDAPLGYVGRNLAQALGIEKTTKKNMVMNFNANYIKAMDKIGNRQAIQNLYFHELLHKNQRDIVLLAKDPSHIFKTPTWLLEGSVRIYTEEEFGSAPFVTPVHYNEFRSWTVKLMQKADTYGGPGTGKKLLAQANFGKAKWGREIFQDFFEKHGKHPQTLLDFFESQEKNYDKFFDLIDQPIQDLDVIAEAHKDIIETKKFIKDLFALL